MALSLRRNTKQTKLLKSCLSIAIWNSKQFYIKKNPLRNKQTGLSICSLNLALLSCHIMPFPNREVTSMFYNWIIKPIGLKSKETSILSSANILLYLSIPKIVFMNFNYLLNVNFPTAFKTLTMWPVGIWSSARAGIPALPFESIFFKNA